jgi:uncharacterized protein
MSKSEASGAKSLEEILASIRKSLVGERADAVKQPEAEQAAVSPTGDGDGLSARLAGALGAPANGAAHDDDFTELLAPEEKRAGPTAAPEAPAAEPQDKHPVWLLRRQSSNGDGQEQETATVRTTLPEPTPVEQEPVRLSRPEVLRASLPPLFGAEDEPSPPSRAVPSEPKPAPNLPAMGLGLAAPAFPGHAPKPGAANPPAAPKTKPLLSPEADEAESGRIEPSGMAQPISQTPKFAEPALPAGPAPLPPIIERSASGIFPRQADQSPANPPARTIEQVIGELLEPVIRHWLEANLPRLVEEMVRKEVARAFPKDQNPPQV